MNAFYLLYGLNFLFPFVMLLVGFNLKKHPYNKIGSNGYSTPQSRKSQECWDYAQLIMPDVFITMGKTLTIIMLIITVYSFMMKIDVDNSVKLSTFIGIIGLGVSFGIVEYKLSTIKN